MRCAMAALGDVGSFTSKWAQFPALCHSSTRHGRAYGRGQPESDVKRSRSVSASQWLASDRIRQPLHDRQ